MSAATTGTLDLVPAQPGTTTNINPGGGAAAADTGAGKSPRAKLRSLSAGQAEVDTAAMAEEDIYEVRIGVVGVGGDVNAGERCAQ